jgi:hypothetical protein
LEEREGKIGRQAAVLNLRSELAMAPMRMTFLITIGLFAIGVGAHQSGLVPVAYVLGALTLAMGAVSLVIKQRAIGKTRDALGLLYSPRELPPADDPGYKRWCDRYGVTPYALRDDDIHPSG